METVEISTKPETPSRKYLVATSPQVLDQSIDNKVQTEDLGVQPPTWSLIAETLGENQDVIS